MLAMCEFLSVQAKYMQCVNWCLWLKLFTSVQVLFKMDDSGNGKLVELRDLGKANKSLIVTTCQSTWSMLYSVWWCCILSMQGFTQDSFRQMCILSGCDYLSSVPGVGLGKALKFMRKFNQNPYKVRHAQTLSRDIALVITPISEAKN